MTFSIGKPRSSSFFRISMPTAPVAPATPTFGRLSPLREEREEREARPYWYAMPRTADRVLAMPRMAGEGDRSRVMSDDVALQRNRREIL